MDQRFRWIGLALVLMSIAGGVIAYNAGVSHGLAMTAPAAGGGAPVVNYYGRGWGWGWGFFPFGIFLWLFVLRFLFGGWGPRRWYYRHGPWGGPYGPYDGPGSFDDWHRRAHERMNNQPRNEDSPGR